VKPAYRLTIIILAAAILLVVPAAVTFYTDWLWFAEVGYQPVLMRQILAQLALGLGVGVVVFGLVAANLRVKLRSMAQPYLMLGTLQDGRPLVLDRRQLGRIAAAAALFIAFVLGLSASANWLEVLEYLHQTPFGVADPIFGRDVGFYVFSLPALRFIQGWALAAGGKELTLVNLSEMFMTIYLPTEKAGLVALNSEARIVLDALPGQVIPATVSFVAPKAQFTARCFAPGVGTTVWTLASAFKSSALWSNPAPPCHCKCTTTALSTGLW